MVILTKIDGSRISVNPDMIKFVEETPDTVITMFTGEKMLVREPQEFIIQKIMLLRKKILRGLLR